MKDEIKISDQIWMNQNLNVSSFQNGEPIKEIKSIWEWTKAKMNKTPAFCYYNFDPKNALLLGKLYNWYALTDPRKLAPNQWRIPNKTDWNQLKESISNNNTTSNTLKKIEFWEEDHFYELENKNYFFKKSNQLNSPSIGFNALPSGYGGSNGLFYAIGKAEHWWVKNENEFDTPKVMSLYNNSKRLYSEFVQKEYFFPVRCIKI